jgi:hypothetical protein
VDQASAHRPRQHEFSIAAWALPISIILGAFYGHFNTPNDDGWGYVRGAVAGALICTGILLLEFTAFWRTRSALARRMVFTLYLALRSFGYLAMILIGLAASALLVPGPAENARLIDSGCSLLDCSELQLQSDPWRERSARPGLCCLISSPVVIADPASSNACCFS